MDCHQVKAKRFPNTVTATYINWSPVAHEISSGEAPKGGKFKDNSCIDISFLQLPSHVEIHTIFINITGEQYLLTNYKRHQEAERDATTKDFDYKCNTRFVRNIPENQKQHKKCCCVKYYGISDYSKIVDTCLNLRLLGFLCSLHYFYRFYERIFTDELSTTLSLSRVC